MIWVPIICPKSAAERLFKEVQGEREIMRLIPDFTDNGKQYIERDFLFAIVNTIDKTTSENRWQKSR